jgi:hypothetical protein
MRGRWITKLVVVVLLFKPLDCLSQVAQVNGIAHIALRVSNLDSSRTFFRRLGFEESFSLASGGTTKEVFVKINDHQFIELYPRVDTCQPLGWMHVCYEADSLNDLNSAYVTRGLKPSPESRAEPAISFFLSGIQQNGSLSLRNTCRALSISWIEENIWVCTESRPS